MEVSGIIQVEDIEGLAEKMEKGTTAAALLFENLWAIKFKEAVLRANGRFSSIYGFPPKLWRKPWNDWPALKERLISLLAGQIIICIRRYNMRRRSVGRTVARAAVGTAVVAGTAGAVHHHQEQKWANQKPQQQQPYDQAYQQGAADAQAQQPSMHRRRRQYAPPPPQALRRRMI